MTGDPSARRSSEKPSSPDATPRLKPDDPRRESLDFNGDIELGSVPLLSPGAEHQRRESSDSDFPIEEEQIRYDPPFSCTASGFCAWLRGPTPPHVYHVRPWFPKFQAAPARLVERWVPSRIGKFALLANALAFWIVVFFSSIKASSAGQAVPGYGQPVRLSCHHRLWYVKLNW